MGVCVCVCAHHSQTITQKAPAGEFESTFSILRQDHPDYTASENMPFCLRVFLQEVAVRFFVQKYDFSKSFSSIVYTLTKCLIGTPGSLTNQRMRLLGIYVHNFRQKKANIHNLSDVSQKPKERVIGQPLH